MLFIVTFNICASIAIVNSRQLLEYYEFGWAVYLGDLMEDHDITIREVARELNRLARAIDSLSSEIKADMAAIRKDTVRQDVYSADRRTDEVEINDIQRRLESMELRAKSLTTAFTGMLLSVMGGVIIFLITRGFN